MSALDVAALGFAGGFLFGVCIVRLAIRWGVLHSKANCPHAKDVP